MPHSVVSTSSTCQAAQHAELICMMTSKIAQSLLLVQQRDLVDHHPSLLPHDNHGEIIVTAEMPPPSAPAILVDSSVSATAVEIPEVTNTSITTVTAVAAAAAPTPSEQLLLFFRSERGKIYGHSTVFGSNYALEQCMVVGALLAELVAAGRITILKRTTPGGWFRSATVDAYIVLNESTLYLPTNSPALDEILSNINLATLKTQGQHLNARQRRAERSISVQKFLSQYFVGKNFGYKVTAAILDGMVEKDILTKRKIHCGLFWMFQRHKFEDTTSTKSIEQTTKRAIRTALFDHSNASISAKIVLRFLTDAHYVKHIFSAQTYRLSNYLTKVIDKEEIDNINFGVTLGQSLSVPSFAEFPWNQRPMCYRQHLCRTGTSLQSLKKTLWLDSCSWEEHGSKLQSANNNQ
jgi:hypothetical protein